MSETATIQLRQVCSNRCVTAQLVGVTSEELDVRSAAAIFRYFHVSAISDENLPASECNGMSYGVLGGDEEDAAGPEEAARSEDVDASDVDASVVVSDKLRELSSLIDVAIEMDPDIREQDYSVIERALQRSATTSSMNLQLLKQHLMNVLRKVFSSESVQSSTPIKVIMKFAMVARYCYSFCKRVFQHLRKREMEVLPESVFDLMCTVVSVLLGHLHAIGWTAVIAAIGGWAGALQSLASLSWKSLTLPSQNFFLITSLVSGGIYVLCLSYKYWK